MSMSIPLRFGTRYEAPDCEDIRNNRRIGRPLMVMFGSELGMQSMTSPVLGAAGRCFEACRGYMHMRHGRMLDSQRSL